jgi:hypothetical protein
MQIRKTTFAEDDNFKEREFQKLSGEERLRLLRIWNDMYRAMHPVNPPLTIRIVRGK